MTGKFITLTSDFGVQTQGVGLMEGIARTLAPDAQVIHLMHGLPAFDITAAARTLESVQYLPPGAHVCVCDPGVGSDRKALIVEVGRGDFLIGPDNGVLLPASRVLGGIMRAHCITNEKYMRQPVSPIFHGRDVFVPAAAHLVNGVHIEEFGHLLEISNLVPAIYEEATISGREISCKIIQINKFGSLHLNITHNMWDSFKCPPNSIVYLLSKFSPIKVKVGRIFADVGKGEFVLLKDDYGRIEIATNMGNFIEAHPFLIGDTLIIRHRMC